MAESLRLKVFLTGRVAAEANGHVLDEARFPGRQGRLLFVYLVAARGRPVPRDELADAIWGESPPATWEKTLTVIASKLRSLVAEDGITQIPQQDLRAVQGMNAFFIIPTNWKSNMAEWMMDHPPLEKRLAALAEIAREMGKPVSS